MDRDGLCAPIPESCPPEINLVCGCDGVTYDSPCWAAVKLATIKHSGACKE